MTTCELKGCGFMHVLRVPQQVLYVPFISTFIELFTLCSLCSTHSPCQHVICSIVYVLVFVVVLELERLALQFGHVHVSSSWLDK